MERFSQGLVLLHLLYRLPWKTIPYLIANENTSSEKPIYTNETRERYLSHGLQADKALYDASMEMMDNYTKIAGEDRVKGLVDLLEETNKAIKSTCTEKARDNNDCIVHNVHALHGVACFHTCIENVTTEFFLKSPSLFY